MLFWFIGLFFINALISSPMFDGRIQQNPSKMNKSLYITALTAAGVWVFVIVFATFLEYKSGHADGLGIGLSIIVGGSLAVLVVKRFTEVLFSNRSRSTKAGPNTS